MTLVVVVELTVEFLDFQTKKSFSGKVPYLCAGEKEKIDELGAVS